MQRHSRHRRRRGFTVLELLVVITIIAIVAAISLSVFGSAMESAHVARTRATVEKVSAIVKDRLGDIERSMTKGGLRQHLKDALSGNESVVDETFAEAIVRKQAFLSAFPQTHTEAGITPTNPANHTPETESAEALYHAIFHGETFGGAAPDTSRFDDEEIKDTDGDGLLELVDGWGRPLRFYRWPTRLVRPTYNPSLPFNDPVNQPRKDVIVLLVPGVSETMLNQDPDYPLAAGVAYRSLVNENTFHTPATYHVPLIVSAGPDGQLGLLEPTSGAGKFAAPKPEVLAAPADSVLNDNITNHMRVGEE